MSKKRANGEGYLRKRKNGTWELTIMTGYHSDGRRKYKSFYGKTQKIVKEKLNQYQEQKKNGIQLDGDIMFSDWADLWYENYEGQVADSTYCNYRYTLRILKDYFGSQKLMDIKPIHIEEFLKAQAQKGNPQSSLAKLRGMMFQIMKKAVANDLLAKNPVEYADFIKASTQPVDKESFTAEEIAILMRNLSRKRIGHSIRLMLGTGIRTQELLALEPRHISPDGSALRIEQAVKLVNGTPVLGSPKSKSSYRTIPIPDSIRDSVIFLRSTTEKFIWSNHRNGRFCNPSTFRKQFKTELELIDGVRVLPPHSTRHTFVSQLQAAGVPMETIQSLTGHASMEMTEHYLHVQDDVKKKAASKLNEIFCPKAA